MFAPEREIIQNIEGHEEKTNVHLNEGTDALYVIYVDESRYKMMKGEKSDFITTLHPLPERYPEVSMEIRQVLDEKPEDLVKIVESN